MKHEYDIFISYRRKDVGDKAEHLKDLLEPFYKKRISFDRENLTGQFNVALIKRIANAKDFLLVLGNHSFVYNDNPDALTTDTDSESYKHAFSPETIKMYHDIASCSDEECINKIQKLGNTTQLDYVRIEIGRALQRSKNLRIIPVVPERTEKFNFASLILPPDISEIKSYEAVFFRDNPDALFKDVVPKIRKHLNSKSDRPITKALIFSAVAIMIALLSIIIFFGRQYFEDSKLFSDCKTYEDFNKYKTEQHTFFMSDCSDKLMLFEQLERGGYAYINNTSGERQKDSISVQWSKDITLNQLSALVGAIDSMMYIPSGSFIMGTDNPLDNEGPAHKVTISQSYYISKFELSRSLWFAIMKDSLVNDATATLPMTDISWIDCHKFITKLNTLINLDFSLPSEAQWEYAASGGGKHKKFAGEGELNAIAWHSGNSMNRLHTTAESRQPNCFELYSMQGNAEEWCEDFAYMDYSSTSQIDPKGPKCGKKHIVRGGSFQTVPEDMTLTYRDAADADNKSNYRGMRLIINL